MGTLLNRSIVRALAGIVAMLAALPAFAAEPSPPPRFFHMGGGSLSIVNAHTDERAKIRYRRADGSYDRDELARLRRIFRSRADGRETDVSLRLIEILSTLQRLAGGREIVLLSGFRSEGFNEDLRRQGRQAAGGSLHTEGIAADVAFPRKDLPRLWRALRDLECCGAGLYVKDGFMHVDVGRPRFWEPSTSRVSENLSAENARLFARTDFDRYRSGETIDVTLHAITLPPIAVAREARLIPARGAAKAVRLEPIGGDADGADAAPARGDRADARAVDDRPARAPGDPSECIDVARGGRLRVPVAPGTGRVRLELRTCEPRLGRTPPTIETNAIEID